MERRERDPLAKIPCHESNGIEYLSIYGELQVTSRYRLGTPGGLGPSGKKTSQSGNFEFCQLLLACLGMGNMASPTVSPPFVAFQIWPSLV